MLQNELKLYKDFLKQITKFKDISRKNLKSRTFNFCMNHENLYQNLRLFSNSTLLISLPRSSLNSSNASFLGGGVLAGTLSARDTPDRLVGVGASPSRSSLFSRSDGWGDFMSLSPLALWDGLLMLLPPVGLWQKTGMIYKDCCVLIWWSKFTVQPSISIWNNRINLKYET